VELVRTVVLVVERQMLLTAAPFGASKHMDTLLRFVGTVCDLCI